MKYYRHPWDKLKLDVLQTWWPHWGTDVIAPMLGLTNQQVKSKVNKLKLTLLKKTERLCYECKTEHQISRSYGIFCKKCKNVKRKILKKNTKKPRHIWMGDILRTFRYRSKGVCDLTLDYLIELWNKQNGLCYYSNLPLQEPYYGSGRIYNVASIDRIDSSLGYVKNNVVWCLWVCNAGKSNLSVNQYIEICKAVSSNSNLKHFNKIL